MADTPDTKAPSKAAQKKADDAAENTAPGAGVDMSTKQTVKVKTAGNYMIYDVWSGQEVLPGDEFQEVVLTPFIQGKIDSKELEVSK